jgi:hypothetical protein
MSDGRSIHPQNPAEHAARDQNITHANVVVADLIGFARAALRPGGDEADAFVQVGLRCADRAVECRDGGEVPYLIALLTAAVLATARHLERSHD